MGVSLSPEQLELASKLTTLQRKFVINLVGSKMSQREAYVAAGGRAKSDSAKDNSASVMLSKTKVKGFYDSLLNTATTSAVMTREEALERLTLSARVRITDVCDFRNVQTGEDPDGDPVYQTVWTIKNSEDIPAEIAACIKSVAITNQGPKIELHDQTAATKQISDMQGWNAPKKTELTGKDGQSLAITADVSSPDIVAALASLMEKL